MKSVIIYTDSVSNDEFLCSKETLFLNDIKNISESDILNEILKAKKNWLESEIDNLDVKINNCDNIIGIDNFNSKNYFIINSDRLNSIFILLKEKDYCTYFVDNKNIKAVCNHHDGVNTYTFRSIKKGVNIDNLLSKLDNSSATKNDINRYTNSLYNYVKSIYC